VQKRRELCIDLRAVRGQLSAGLDVFVERGATHVAGAVDGGLEADVVVVHDDGYEIVEIATRLLDIVGEYVLVSGTEISDGPLGFRKRSIHVGEGDKVVDTILECLHEGIFDNIIGELHVEEYSRRSKRGLHPLLMRLSSTYSSVLGTSPVSR
jgi:hypothetical protein